MSTVTISQSPYAVHNSEIAPFARARGEHYTLAELRSIISLLAGRGTLNLHRWANGACSAVTPPLVDISELKATRQGENLLYCWLRDNGLQAWGEWMTNRSPFLTQLAPLSRPNQWRGGADCFLNHYRDNAWKFRRIILGETWPEHPNASEHPPVVLDLDLGPVGRPWGHIQHDAHGIFSALLHARLNDGSLDWDEPTRNLLLPYMVLLHAYHWKLQVWQHWDFGCWERHPVAQHWSSICPLAIGFALQRDFLEANGHEFAYTLEGHEYKLHVKGVRELLDQCVGVLNELGTNEFIRSTYGTRTADLAKLNGLFLQAVTGAHVVDDATAVAIVRQILDLMGEHGCRRFEGDPWDGRVDRSDIEFPAQQAQWCHAAPQLVPVLLDLYERTGQPWLLDEAHLRLGMGLGSITEDWTGAEAYIIHPETRLWTPDDNRPFAWWASMMRCALASMERFLGTQAVLAPKAA